MEKSTTKKASARPKTLKLRKAKVLPSIKNLRCIIGPNVGVQSKTN